MFFPVGYLPESVSVWRAPLRPPIIRTLAAILLSAPLSSPVYAQRDNPLTVTEAEDLALAAEPGEQSLRARAAALEEQAVVAGHLPDPVLRLALNNYPIQSGGFSTEGMTNAMAGFRQEFPAGQTRDIGTRQFDALATDMNRQADARGRDVLTATRVSWLELYYWSNAFALVTESRPFFADLATITRSLYAVGRKNQQDVLLAELELSRLDDRLIRIERRQAGARAELRQWIGGAADRRVADKLPQWGNLPALENMVGQLAEHPALRAADAKVSAREAGVDLAEQRSKPGWALDVGYSYREGMLTSGEPRPDFISVGVTVDMPFFRRKSIDSTLSAALQEKSAALADKQVLTRGLESRLRNEHARWQERSHRLTLYEERVLIQASDHAQATLLAYQSDRSDFADVMRSYIDDLNTRIDYLRLQVEREQSFALLANLGGIPR